MYFFGQGGPHVEIGNCRWRHTLDPRGISALIRETTDRSSAGLVIVSSSLSIHPLSLGWGRARGFGRMGAGTGGGTKLQ